MAQMTAAQTAAELQRKANLGIKPTSTANNAAYEKLVQQKPTTNANPQVSASGTVPGGLTSSGGGWFSAIDALKNSQNTTPGAAIGAGVSNAPVNTVSAPQPQMSSAVYTPPPSAAAAPPPTAMMQAMKELPTYVPPKATGINFNDATTQVKGQLDPMFQRALEALQAQKHQDQLNGDQLGMARGGSHSGLAADLQNKVAIASAGKASDLDATRQTQTAQMAQDLVNRGQDNDFRNNQAALAEYLGINQLNLQSQNQNFQQGVQNADLTGWYQGLQTLASKNADRGYGLDLAGLTGNINGQQTLQSQSQGFNQNLQTKQLERGNFESDRSYELAKSSQEWNQTFQKEQYSDQKAQQIWDNTFKDKSFTQSMKDAAASRGLQWANLDQGHKEFIANQEFREKSFTADQDQRTLDNQYRTDQAAWDKNSLNPKNSPNGTSGNFNLDDYKGYINQNYYKDVPANPTNPFDTKTTKQFDTQNARKYIIGQGLTDQQTDQLLKLYNLPTN